MKNDKPLWFSVRYFVALCEILRGLCGKKRIKPQTCPNELVQAGGHKEDTKTTEKGKSEEQGKRMKEVGSIQSQLAVSQFNSLVI